MNYLSKKSLVDILNDCFLRKKFSYFFNKNILYQVYIKTESVMHNYTNFFHYLWEIHENNWELIIRLSHVKNVFQTSDQNKLQVH